MPYLMKNTFLPLIAVLVHEFIHIQKYGFANQQCKSNEKLYYCSNSLTAVECEINYYFQLASLSQ